MKIIPTRRTAAGAFEEAWEKAALKARQYEVVIMDELHWLLENDQAERAQELAKRMEGITHD